MKKLGTAFYIFVLLLSQTASAQTYPDTASILFGPNMLLADTIKQPFWSAWPSALDSFTVISIVDSSTSLWQIGTSSKSVFTDTVGRSPGIMTDTVGPYPANANAFFALEFGGQLNYLIKFWHRFETDSFHAGGVVELSTDSGATWINVYGGCYDTGFDHVSDIFSGDLAFTGNSGGQTMSRFMVITCRGHRTTATSCHNSYFIGSCWIRFRFLSDATVSSKSGWKIDSVQIIVIGCPGLVPETHAGAGITMTPNPTSDLLQIKSSQTDNHVSIYDLTGRSVLSADFQDYETELSVGNLPTRLYIVRVNGTVIGKLLKR